MTERQAIKIINEEKSWESDDRKIDAFITAVNALGEIQKYRELEQKLNGVDLAMLVNHFMAMAAEGEIQGYQRGRILTNGDADKWDAYLSIGTPEECQEAVEKQKTNKESESHDEKHILESCIALVQEMVNEFAEWYRWQHGEDAIEELDDEKRFCIRKTYFRIVQELFLIGTNHSGGTSTRAKCEQLGVDWGKEIEFDWSDEEWEG